MSKRRRERPEGAHSTKELTSLLPELVIPAADIARCNDSWRRASLDEKGRRVAGQVMEMLDALAKRYKRMNHIMQNGGTFANIDIDILVAEDRHQGNISAEEVSEVRSAWYKTNERLTQVTREATGNPRLRKTTYKAYGGVKTGIGLHRDSAFADNDTREVASIGLRGVNRFSVWAVPASLGLEVEQLVGDPVDPDIGITALHQGGLIRLKPIATMSQTVGDIIHIDEVNGSWISDELGAMSVWHSAQRASSQPRLGAIIRS